MIGKNLGGGRSSVDLSVTGVKTGTSICKSVKGLVCKAKGECNGGRIKIDY